MASAPGQAKTNNGRPGSATADGRYKFAFLVLLPPHAAFSRIRRVLCVLPPFALCITKAWQPGYTGRPGTTGRASTPPCHRPPRARPVHHVVLVVKVFRAHAHPSPTLSLTGVLLVGGPPLRSLPWAGSACARWASAARQCFSTPTTAAFSCEVLLSYDRRLRRLLLVSLVVRAALFFYVAVVMMAAFLAHRAHEAPRGAPPPPAC